MSFWIGFGIYTLAMLFVWGFFFIAKLHIHKFRDYSAHVGPVTKFMTFLLLVLTIAGYVVVFNMDSPAVKTQSAEKKSVEEIY